MEMRPVRVSTSVFSALPIHNRTHNLSVINNVFNALIASLGAFANLLHKRVSLFFVGVEIRINV